MSTPLSLSPQDCSAALERALGARGGRVTIDPDTVEQDLARLVLTLMEFLRELMELQAVRRMEAGTLTPTEEEDLGLTLMRSADAIGEVAARFGLRPEDLRLDLGPLGRLV